MLAGAGGYIPEWAGKRSKYMQCRGGEASWEVGTNHAVVDWECHPERRGSPARGRCRGVEGPLWADV